MLQDWTGISEGRDPVYLYASTHPDADKYILAAEYLTRDVRSHTSGIETLKKFFDKLKRYGYPTKEENVDLDKIFHLYVEGNSFTPYVFACCKDQRISNWMLDIIYDC